VEHLFHHVQTWVPLVRARDPETKLLVDVDRCLVVIPDVGDDVVDVSHFGLLEHPLHQLLGHTLPPVPIEGADEAKVEAVVVRQLATDCSGQHVIPVGEECESRILLDKLAPLVRGHVRHSQDWEDLLVDVPQQGQVSRAHLLKPYPPHIGVWLIFSGRSLFGDSPCTLR